MSPEFTRKLLRAEEEFRKEAPYTIECEAPIPRTLREFLIFFLINKTNHKTYDPQGICVGNSMHEYRSHNDIFQTCRTYVNEHISMVEIMEELFELYREEILRTWYCNTLGKRVWFSYRNNFDYSGNYKMDELGLINKNYKEEMDVTTSCC